MSSVFLKAVGCILVSVILCIILAKDGKDFSVIVCIVVCCVVFGAAIWFLQPVITLISNLQQSGQLQAGHVSVILKAVGISVVAHLAGLICADAGYSALEKALSVLTTAALLCMSVPLLQELMGIVESVLGKL